MVWISAFSLPIPFLYYFFIPESYRILIAQGHFIEARRVMMKFVKSRKIENKLLHETNIYSEEEDITTSVNNIIGSIHSVAVQEQHERETYSCFTIFKDKYMATTFVILMLIWYVEFLI